MIPNSLTQVSGTSRDATSIRCFNFNLKLDMGERVVVVVVVVVLLLLLLLLLFFDPSSARIFSLLLPNVNEAFMSFLYTGRAVSDMGGLRGFRGGGVRGWGGGVRGFGGGGFGVSGGGGDESVHVHVNFIVSALVSLARCLFPGILAFRFDNVVSWGRAYVLCGRVVCVISLLWVAWCHILCYCLPPPPCFPCFRCSVFCCVFW